MRIKLINAFSELGVFRKKIFFRFRPPPIAVATLAALTPPDIEVSIIDMAIEEVDFDDPVDLVGISSMTPNVMEAYRVADEFRRRDVRVVLGGIHASMLPQEAIQHADSVVIGEAEYLWEGVIRDFQKGRLKRFYFSSKEVDLKDSPVPRWELIDPKKYNVFLLQISRGCPNKCRYCCVTKFLGKKMRFKPIENIKREMEIIHHIAPHKGIALSGDNFGINPLIAKQIVELLKSFSFSGWAAQACVNIADESELLQEMSESNCHSIMMGFESFSVEALRWLGKAHINKPEEYMKKVEKIQSYRIPILAMFMAGADGETKEDLEKVIDFVEKNKIPAAALVTLTPYPGTSIYEVLEKEGRILHKDWSKYNQFDVCFKPKSMSTEELREKVLSISERLLNYDSLYKRLSTSWRRGMGLHRKRWNFLRIGKLTLFLKGIKCLLKKGDWAKMWFILRCLFNPYNPEHHFIYQLLDEREICEERRRVITNN